MKINITILLILLLSLLSTGCSNSMKKAELYIASDILLEIDNVKYKVNMFHILSEDNIDKQIGEVAKVIPLDTPNPNSYRNPKNIYSLKNKKVEDEVALEMNGKLYLATSNGL